MARIRRVGEHNGVDISTGINSNIYSIVKGVVTDKGFQQNGFGNYVVIKDTLTNLGFLFGHLKEPTPLNAGDTIDYGDFVGIEGTSGNSTGIHLHISCQDMTNKNNWTFGLPISQLINPCHYMGFPNILNSRVIYTGKFNPNMRKTNNRKWLESFSKNFRIFI